MKFVDLLNGTIDALTALKREAEQVGNPDINALIYEPQSAPYTIQLLLQCVTAINSGTIRCLERK
jgi:hypothetical protein